MLTSTNIADIGRSATAGVTPTTSAPSFDPWVLVAEAYFGLWSVGKVPAGGMQDPAGAVRAAEDLLRAFGVIPVRSDDPTAETQAAVRAVAAVCGVAR
jgi:hypothetical protein